MTKELKLIKNRYLNRLIKRTKRACSRICTLCVHVCMCVWLGILETESVLWTFFLSFHRFTRICFFKTRKCGWYSSELTSSILFAYILVSFCSFFFCIYRYTYITQYGIVPKNAVFSASSSSSLHHWYCSLTFYNNSTLICIWMSVSFLVAPSIVNRIHLINQKEYVYQSINWNSIVYTFNPIPSNPIDMRGEKTWKECKRENVNIGTGSWSWSYTHHHNVLCCRVLKWIDSVTPALKRVSAYTRHTKSYICLLTTMMMIIGSHYILNFNNLRFR